MLVHDVVDFAVFDAECDTSLSLLVSHATIDRYSCANPIFLIANYVLDSLRQDVFRVVDGQLQEGLITVMSDSEYEPDLNDPSNIRIRARAYVGDMRISYYCGCVYVCVYVLTALIKRFRSTWSYRDVDNTTDNPYYTGAHSDCNVILHNAVVTHHHALTHVACIVHTSYIGVLMCHHTESQQSITPIHLHLSHAVLSLSNLLLIIPHPRGRSVAAA